MRLFDLFRGDEQRDTSTLAEPSEWLADALTGGPTFTGRPMSPKKAIEIPAVFSAVRLLATSLGSLPLHVLRQDATHRTKAVDTRLWTLLHDEANPEMTSGEVVELVVGHLCLWGNAYLVKARDGNGLVHELWPWNPAQVEVGRDERDRKYFRMTDTKGQLWEADERSVLHIRAFGFDGLRGLSPITVLRQSLATQSAQQEYQARFYSNDATPGGVISIPNALDEGAAKRLKDNWEAAHKGLANAARVAVLEQGATFNQLQLPFEDQQFIEQRRMGVQEIARIYNIPAWKLGESAGDSLTYSTVEQSNIAFVQDAIRPLAVRIEKSFERDGDLRTTPDLKVKFKLDAMLRADTKTRHESYIMALDPQKGWMTKNEVRELEDLDPVEGGDELPAPVQPSEVRDLREPTRADDES